MTDFDFKDISIENAKIKILVATQHLIDGKVDESIASSLIALAMLTVVKMEEDKRWDKRLDNSLEVIRRELK